MSSEAIINEARRQLEICNACRYCEGYCSVFPALMRNRTFSEQDITQLANLCHNCRGCYYACQYAEPHEFALNLPAALAEARQQSWKECSWPRGFSVLFERNGITISACLVICVSFLFWICSAMRPESGEGFYATFSHGMMVSIFTPAFLFPLLAMSVSISRYWRSVGGKSVRLSDIRAAFSEAARMKNLSNCNYESEDIYSNRRLWLHQATLYGFALCFLSTSSGTILHYGFGIEAPYSFWTLPKLLGVPGGILLCAGTLGLAILKLHADRSLGDANAWGGEMAFILLLFSVSASGLILYAATDSFLVDFLLPLHLGMVLTFFVLMPYSKMAHGFYRLAALARDAAIEREEG